MLYIIKNLLGVMTPMQKKKFYVLQFFVVLTALLEVLSVFSIGPFMALVGNLELLKSNAVYNYFYLGAGEPDPYVFLFWIGLLVLFFLFAASLVSIITVWKLSIFAARLGADFGNSLYEYYLGKSFLYHSRVNSSFLTKQIATEVNRVTDNVIQPFVQINARIVACLFISFFVFLYSPVVSLVGVLVLMSCYGLLFWFVKGRLVRNGQAISEASKKRYLLINEGFGAVKEVHLLNRERNLIDLFKLSGDVFAGSYGTSNGLYNMPRYIMEFVVYSGMIALILALIVAHEGNLSDILPVMAVLGISAFKLLPSFQQIYSGAAQIKSNLSAFEAIKDDLLASRKMAEAPVETSTVGAKASEGVGLRLSDIYFKYPEKERNAIDGVNLYIPPRSIIGIVGASGSGKSTLVDIMLGLIPPDSGEVKFGDEKLNASNVRLWQKNVGYVPQSIFLKDGSIAENIAFGLSLDDVDFDKVNSAIKLAHLDSFIEALPEGLMTCIGERGVQLSGGQRQRIGIARSLYNDAKYLFFDEATSALDGVTENIIMEAIDSMSGYKTIVMIAHRLNTVKKCTHIFFMENGRIADQGSYEYLLANNSSFKAMAMGTNEYDK